AHGFQTTSVNSPEGAARAVREREFDAAIIDMNFTRDTTSGHEGLDLLSAMSQIDSTLPVIVLTAWGGVELAVEVMRRGAKDFLQKPWENERLLAVVRNQVAICASDRQRRRLQAENSLLRDQFVEAPEIVAESPAMRAVIATVASVA